jgi:hypothetical protein
MEIINFKILEPDTEVPAYPFRISPDQSKASRAIACIPYLWI